MSAFVCGFSFVWHLIFSFQKKNLRFSGFDILFGFPICRPGWELGWSAQWTQWFWCKRERFWWKQRRGKRRRRLQYGGHNSKHEIGTSTYFLFRARSRFGRAVRTKNRLLFCAGHFVVFIPSLNIQVLVFADVAEITASVCFIILRFNDINDI